MDLDPTRPDNIEPGPLTGSTDVDKLIIWPNPDTDYYLLSFIFFHFFLIIHIIFVLFASRPSVFNVCYYIGVSFFLVNMEDADKVI